MLYVGLGKTPRFHVRLNEQSQNVGLEIASAVEVSAERRLTGRVRAEMTVSVVAPGTADAADARGRQSRESQRIPNSKRPTRGRFETLMRLRRSFGLLPMAAVVENLSGDGAFVRTTETINPGEQVFLVFRLSATAHGTARRGARAGHPIGASVESARRNCVRFRSHRLRDAGCIARRAVHTSDGRAAAKAH